MAVSERTWKSAQPSHRLSVGFWFRVGNGLGLRGYVLGELAASGAGVVADPPGDLAGEGGCLGPVAVPGIAGLAASLVEADQRVAFLLTRRHFGTGEHVTELRPDLGTRLRPGCGSPFGAMVRAAAPPVADGKRPRAAGHQQCGADAWRDRRCCQDPAAESGQCSGRIEDQPQHPQRQAAERSPRRALFR
jgi:hypothetical protein